MPCASSGADDCEWDKDLMEEYLGPQWDMVVYHNQREFDEHGFKEGAVKEFSVITKVRNVGLIPKFTEFFNNKNTILDEVALL